MTRAHLQRALEFAIAVGILVVGVTLCRRGIILSDEGYLLMQALDMARGKVLYRDMDSFVAPGVWFLLAALFRAVEPSVIATRVPALACYLVMVAASVRIADRVAGRTCALATAVGLGVATVWAFPAWTMSFYSPYSVMFALVALERLVAWQSTGRSGTLVWSGVCIGLSILFKQNYGIFAAVGCGVTVVVSVLISQAPWRLGAVVSASARFAVGVIVPLVPAVAYFLHHGAARDAFEALVMHPFRGFLVAHTIPYLALSELIEPSAMAGAGRFTYGAYAMVKTGLHLRWPEVAIRGVEQLHILLYWLPPLVFVVAAGVVVRSMLRGGLDRGLLAVLSVAGLVFLGVFPRADFNHLVNVYQPVVLLAAVVGQRLLALGTGRGRRVAGATLMGGLAALYALVATIWLVGLLGLMRAPLESPRGGVMVDLWEAGMIDAEVRGIRERTASDEPVLTVPGLAMLNFLAERDMPGRYYNLYAVHIAHDRGAGVVEATERLGTRLAVADYNNFFSDAAGLRDYAPVLADYLRRHFAPLASVAIDKHLMLERRAVPLAERALTKNPLAHCDLPVEEFADRAVRQHLFFDALYHYIRNTGAEGAGKDPRVLETACAVHVPEAARLRVRIGYRQPSAIGDGASLIAEVRVREDDREPLLHARLHLEATDGWESPPPAEYVIDLKQLAGSDVTLVFRTILEGQVEMNPLQLWGFAMVWHDPQIESGVKFADGMDRRSKVRKLPDL